MDGTGVLLSGFIQAAEGKLDVEVIPYPEDRAMDYEELAVYVAGKLPKSQRYLLLGESFGGPLALKIAAKRPPGLVGVVLCASFARFPVSSVRLLWPAASIAPVWVPPERVLSWMLLGRWTSRALVQQLSGVLRRLNPDLLRVRVAAALRVDVLGVVSRLSLPLLLLRATEDRVISASAVSAMVRAAPGAVVADVSAPHFILQTAPVECVSIVAAFAHGAAF